MKIMPPSGTGKITQIKKEIKKLAMAHSIHVYKHPFILLIYILQSKLSMCKK